MEQKEIKMKHQKVVVMLLLGLLLLSTAMPVQAASSTSTLPPLPEWPIIGPILKWLGVVEPEPAEIVELPEDLDLPHYPIETLDDIIALRDLEVEERVRITATDTALTTIAQEALDEYTDGVQNFKLTLTPGKASVYVEVDPSVLEKTNLDLPINFKNTLKLESVASFGASGCRATVIIEKVSINKWSIGMKGVVQQWLNEQLPELWPSEVCVERIMVKSGEVSVVGYRR